MEKEKLDILIKELELTITKIHGEDWGHSNLNEISNNYIELCYKIEREFTKDEEIIEAIYSFKVENNLIPEKENSPSTVVSGKRKLETNTDNIKAPKKRTKFSYDSITKVQLNTELCKAFYNIKSQTIKKVLSNLPQVEKDEALASIEAKVAIQKSDALTIFNTFPDRGEDIFKKFKQNIKIEIGIILEELKEKFPNVLVVANKAHRSYFLAATHEINWDLSDISESNSYAFHNEEHYEQQKKFTKTINKFFTNGGTTSPAISRLLKEFLSELDIEQDKKDKILATIEEDITEAQTVAKESFTPDNDQQNDKALADFKIKVQSIIIEQITNLKLEIDSQSTSNTESMNKLIDDFIAKISAKLYRYKSNFEKYTNLDDSEEPDIVETEETNDSVAEKSLSNSEEKISGDKLSGQDSPKKEEFKLVHQENSDTNRNDIIVKIQMIEEFNNLPELLTRFFTRFKEFIESFPKAMEEFLSCAKNKFIIISGENLEMGSHAKSEEIVYKGENLPDSKPKILVGDIPIPFEFTPERSSMDISSLIQENSVNGLINEMFNAREIFF